MHVHRTPRGSVAARIAWLSTASILAVTCWGLLQVAADRTHDNWDLLAYVGLLHELEVTLEGLPDERRNEEIHRRSFDAVKPEVPARRWEELTAHPRYRHHPQYAWAREVADDADAFVDELRWYRSRVGFTAGTFLAHRAGLSPADAVHGVALAGYAALVVLLWAWTGSLWAPRRRPWIGPVAGCAVALGAAASAPLADVARLITPDLPATALLLAGLWALLAGRRAGLALALFLLSVLFRPDHALTLLFVLAAAALTPRLVPGSRRRLLYGGMVALPALYLALGAWSGHPGWGRLFLYHFHHKLATGPLDATIYLGAFGDLPSELGLMSSPLFFVLGIVLLPLLCRRRPPLPAGYGAVLAALLIAFGIRFFLFPVLWDRFWIALDLYVLVVLVGVLARPGSEVHAAQA